MLNYPSQNPPAVSFARLASWGMLCSGISGRIRQRDKPWKTRLLFGDEDPSTRQTEESQPRAKGRKPWGEGLPCPTLVLAQEPTRGRGQTHTLLEPKATVVVNRCLGPQLPSETWERELTNKNTQLVKI